MGRRSGARSPEMRRRILLTGVLLSALVAASRSFQLGVLEGERYQLAALNQQGDTLSLPAPRGTIYDRAGVPLAASREVFSIAIAPGEIADSAYVRSLLREHLGLTSQQAIRHTDPRRSWIVLPGRFGPGAREALDGVPGIHFERVLQRFYPNGELALELLGRVGLDGVAQSGLELEFDTVLHGRAGRAVVRRDARGRTLPGVMLRAVEPVPGRDLQLTLDFDLQEIAEQALREAIERTGSVGGELLMTDPGTGEILATVSRDRNGRARSWRAVTDPYEPGSTIKPLTAAALLGLGRATLTDSIYGEQGRYELHGRTLSDVGRGHGWLTLAEALQVSSNIALAKAAARLRPDEQYVALRDFGFGTPTGVTYPSESGGRLRRPAQWSRQSSASLAIGYEVSVTPLQMAMAYGALANGGILFAPRLVREVRSRDGRVERSTEPRPIRRVIPVEVATALRDVLVGAVEEGTGRGAALGSFSVAGKTGTVRIAAGGSYRAGAYYASFAGFFPAEDPQLVIVVKLDEPRGPYYGGATAAPVTRMTLEAALAARNSPLDRGAMARAVPTLADAPAAAALTLPAPAQGARVSAAATSQAVVPGSTVRRAAPAGQDGATHVAAGVTHDVRAVPDVTGMPLRDGVRRLHEAGFRLRVEGGGRVLRTEPVAGDAVPTTRVIRVIGEKSA
jgi:cell division protein FtsI (penicillin-binding protein 3)